MKSTLGTIVGFASCSLLALPVHAAEQTAVDKPVRQQVFERLDKNQDGNLDVEEFLDGSVGRAAGNKQEKFQLRDADGNGFLSFAEYRAPEKRERPDPKTQMRELDADGDGKLTLEEYLADKSARVACRRTFLRHDTDEDGLVTLDELKRWVEGSKLSQNVMFKMRDDNQDGKLTVQEFNLWRDDPGKILAGEAEFARHDDDGDGFLTFTEFQFTPAAGEPTLDAVFEKMDTNGDSRLTPGELTKSMPAGEAAWARDTFAGFDANNDGALDLAEFKARREELDRRYDARTVPQEWPWWSKLLVRAGLLVVSGVMLVLLIPWLWIRRPRRLRRALVRMEWLKRRLTVVFEAAGRRWRWGFGLLALGTVCLLSPQVWRTFAQNLETTSPVSALTFPEPTEFEEHSRSMGTDVSGIRSVAFSDNGRLLAVAHGRGRTAGGVRVWFLNKRKVFASWEEPRGVHSVHIAPNGRLVASQSASDRRVRIRSVESGEDVLAIDVGGKSARVRFSPDGETLATASTDGEIKLWNVDDGMEKKTLGSFSFHLQSLAFSRDGKRIVAGGGLYGRFGGRGTRLDTARATEASTPESPTPEAPIPEPPPPKHFGWAGVWDLASGTQIAEMKDMPDAVLGIAISPNGKLVATAGRDSVARLWEAETGKLVSTLAGHAAALEWVDFSPDGKTLVSGSYDGTAKLWSVDSGQQVATLPEHDGAIMTARFSPDGKTLVTAGSAGLVRLWDPATQQETDVLHPGWIDGDVPMPVLAIAHSPAEKLVASAHGDKTVRLHDPSSGQMVRLLEGNDSLVSSIAFSPDGRLLATAGSDKSVKLRAVDEEGWELKSKTLAGHTDEVLSVAFSPDGTRLASSGKDETIRLWDIAGGDQLAKLAGHAAAVRSVAYSPDGRLLASGDDDGAVKIWAPATFHLLATLTGHAGGIRAVAFSPDGTTLASAGDGKSIKLWDVKRGKVRLTLAGHANGVRCLAFSPRGETLASGGRDSAIKLWDPTSGRARGTLRDHSGAVTSLAFARDTGALWSGSRDKTIRVWKAQPPRFPSIATLEVTGEGARCRFGVFSPDGRAMITAGDDKANRVWDMQTGRILLSDEYRGGTPISGSLSPDGKLLVTGTYGQTAHLWEVASGERVGELITDDKKLYAVDFSRDPARLAVSGGAGTVSVWNAETWKRSWVSATQSLPVMVAVFSPDGKTLATTTYDWKNPQAPGELKLWDAQNGKELAVLSADVRGRTYARFSPDGKLLVTGGADAALTIWEVESRKLRSTIPTPGAVSCLAILPESKLILTGHLGRSLLLWDIDSGRLVAEYVDTPEESRLSVHAAWCSPDGSLIAATGTQGKVVLWATLPEESTARETTAKLALGWSTGKPNHKAKP